MTRPLPERRDSTRRPWSAGPAEPGIVVVDPGAIPTTRQMAVAAAERVRAYYTPLAVAEAGIAARIPLVGQSFHRCALARDLAIKLHRSETAVELARLAVSTAGQNALELGLLMRRNIALDARVPAQLRAGDTVIGQPGGCLASFKRAKVLYGRTVLDHPAARDDYGAQVLRDEAALRPEWAETLQPRPWPPAYAARMQAEIEMADSIIVASTFTARSFDGVVDPSKLRVIPHGVDAATFTPALVGEPSTRLRVLFAGDVTQRNGITYLLEAFHALDPAKYELTIAGPAGRAAAALRRHGRAFRRLDPHQRDMPAVYHAADVVVLPSLLDGSASVVLEAMASGLPVIVTPNTGADAVRHGVEGFVVPLQSSEAIAARLEQFDQDAGLRRRMGAAARARSLEFTWQAFRSAVRHAIGIDAQGPEIQERRELSA